MGRLKVAIALIAWTFLVVPSAAWSHASLVSSEPADHAMVPMSPQVLKLQFNEPVSPVVLILVRPEGTSSTLKDVEAKDQTLTAVAPGPLAKGTHLLSWRVISADGHPVSGTVTFSIGEVSAEPPMRPEFQMDRTLLAGIWLCKLVLYGGLMFGVGGVFFVAWIARSPPPQRSTAFLSVMLQVGLIATVLSVGFQGIDLGNLPLSEIRNTSVWLAALQTSFASTAILASITFIFALWSLHLRSLRRLVAAFALVGVGLALASSGHAASASPRVVMRTAVFLHGTSVAFWVGALIPLLASVRMHRQEDLIEFSRIIPSAIVLLVATGAVLSAVQLETIDAIWTTSYGAVWLAKIAAVLVLLGLGAWNRYAMTPRIVRGIPAAANKLAIFIKVELVVVLLVLGIVATWRFTPPPRSIHAAASAPVQVHIHTAKAMADVRFEPPNGGQRVATIAVWDGNFAPMMVKEVILVLAKPDTGIEPIRSVAAHVQDSTWRVAGLSIPTHGQWRVRVELLINDFEKISLDEEVEFFP